MKQEILTMCEQINAKELKFAKFKLLADEDKTEITVMKGSKFLRIRYNEITDLYDIQEGKIHKFEIIVSDLKTGYYFDMLQSQIERYFKFEYVMMDNIIRRV